MTIKIKFNEIESSEAIRSYVEEKIELLKKYFKNIQQADVTIGMRGRHHNKGKVYFTEVNLHVPGQIVRVSKDAEDLYKSIDKVKDHLKVELTKLRDKMRRVQRSEIRENKEYRI